MAKTRDTSGYTAFGILLDQLCRARGISFQQLGKLSGMGTGAHATILRACRGKSVPERKNLLAWAEILHASRAQRRQMLHAFQYAEDEEMEGKDLPTYSRLIGELAEARERIVELERQVADLKRCLSDYQEQSSR